MTIPEASEYAALIFAPNIDGAFQGVVYNVMEHLSKTSKFPWSLIVVHSKDSEFYVKYALKNVRHVQFIHLEDNYSMTSIADYNKLMLSTEFWSWTKAKTVLLFQTDSLILSSSGGSLDEYLAYDYVGAPWNAVENDRVKDLISQVKLKEGVGNGGFSVRNVAAMTDIARKFQEEQRVVANAEYPQEDLYFVQKLEEFGYKVAPVNVAYKFAVEVPLYDVEPKSSAHTPYGLHASWYYWPEADLKRWFALV